MPKIEILLLILFQFLLYIFFKKKIKNSLIYNKLIDKPGFNKIHSKPISSIGGIFLFSSVLFYLVFIFFYSKYQLIEKNILIFLIGSFFSFFLGLIDDFISIKPDKKLLVVTFFNILLFLEIEFFQTKNLIFSSDYFFIHISVTSLAILISIICFLISHYSLVIIDGVNGLLGMYSLSIFLILLIFLDLSLAMKAFIFYMILIQIILTIFNIKNQFFFGNSGSSFLSTLIPYILLYFYNSRNDTIYLLSYISLVIIPVLDMIRLFVGRIINKKNPFKKDLNHLHHILFFNTNLVWTHIIYLCLSFLPFVFIEFLKFDSIKIIFIQIVLYYVVIVKFNLKRIN